MTSRTRRKILDQGLVTEFAEYRSLKNKIEKWLDAVRENLLAQFKAGFVCPTDGPYLLERESGSRSKVDWQQEFFDYVKQEYESSGSNCEVAEHLAVKKMAEIERRSGSSKFWKIAVKPNPSYAGELMRAIVKKLDTRSQRGF